MAVYLLLLLMMGPDVNTPPDMRVIPVHGYDSCVALAKTFMAGDGPPRHAACIQANNWGEEAQG